MKRWSFVFGFALALGGATRAWSFAKSDTESDCTKCHTLSREEAKTLLQGLVKDVVNVERSEVRGLWVVDVENGGQKGPIYIDYSKEYVFSGNVLKLSTKENLTQKRMIELNRIDFSKIPLDSAIVIGDPAAERKIVVFTDPDCTYCRKLHPELKKAVEGRKDVAFYVKIYNIQHGSYEKARTIACRNSSEMLDDAMAGKEILPAECGPDALEKNLSLGRSLGVQSTPTLVFPDGRVIPGYGTAERILSLVGESGKAGAGTSAGGPAQPGK